jgi:hypothetical protein
MTLNKLVYSQDYRQINILDAVDLSIDMKEREETWQTSHDYWMDCFEMMGGNREELEKMNPTPKQVHDLVNGMAWLHRTYGGKKQ